MKRIAHNKGRKKVGRHYYPPAWRLQQLCLFLFTMTLTLAADSYGNWHELKTLTYASEMKSPYVSSDFSPKNDSGCVTDRCRIEEAIYRNFDNPQEALLIAECESRFNPRTVGDEHLMSYDELNGEMVGDSIGVFQVRTGGEGWNRAQANGMTAEEFRTSLTDIEYNVSYAKDIYDQAGSWSPWYNCAVKTNLL